MNEWFIVRGEQKYFKNLELKQFAVHLLGLRKQAEIKLSVCVCVRVSACWGIPMSAEVCAFVAQLLHTSVTISVECVCLSLCF